ncbi:probable protein ABIL5 isoform X1 [Quercus robur]|uniref:probable protein ABIL5 isoform X1 n=1 Tax=Quercus robur TaxID=38942 RepID=UPI00216155E9|nr:probable protein ABIL5 isoform X1 [Quercus robur]
MQNSKSCSSFQSLDDESEDITRFEKSLQELRELRSQLHYAADYSETTFLNAKEKKVVMENTKEYICRAVVTVVDHLGSASANLDCRISQTNAFSEAEFRINCLKQRLLLCEQYAHKLALTKLRWSENLTRYSRCYLSMQNENVEKSNEGSRDIVDQTNSKMIDKHELNSEEDVPLFLYTNTQRPSLEKETTNSSLVLPVHDGLSVLSKGSNPTFHFQGTQTIGRHRKSAPGGDILSLIRRIKRTA